MSANVLLLCNPATVLCTLLIGWLHFGCCNSKQHTQHQQGSKLTSTMFFNTLFNRWQKQKLRTCFSSSSMALTTLEPPSETPHHAASHSLNSRSLSWMWVAIAFPVCEPFSRSMPRHRLFRW